MSILVANWELVALFFLVAFLYSSVGFGGGSSYLAILALFGLQFSFLRALALLCNLVVVSNGSLQFYRSGFLDLKKIGPMVFISVPMAFLGGLLPLKERIFFILLGFTLLIASLLVWFQPKMNPGSLNSMKKWQEITLGGGIGFLSGVVGIGGGIFLSPILFLLNWDIPKKIAATASFFILVNSLAGLAGQFFSSNWQMDWSFALHLMLAVALGGYLGSYVGVKQLNALWIRRATAVLIAYVSMNLLHKYL